MCRNRGSESQLTIQVSKDHLVAKRTHTGHNQLISKLQYVIVRVSIPDCPQLGNLSHKDHVIDDSCHFRVVIRLTTLMKPKYLCQDD